MKPVIISVFLLFFLHSIASGLNCYQCHEKNSETCEQKVITCPKGEKCMTISEDFKVNGTYRSIYKGCSRNFPCNSVPTGRVNDDIYLFYNIQCCDEDYCNDKSFEKPQLEPYNGLACPSCFDLGSTKDCKTVNVTMCRGDEVQCVNFSIMVRKPDNDIISYSIKACVNSLFCGNPMGQLVGLKVLDRPFFECTSIKPIPLTREMMKKFADEPTIKLDEINKIRYNRRNHHKNQEILH